MGGNFPTKLEQKGRFGRSNKAGQWEKGYKCLMGLANADLQKTNIP
jgi:hypothetical protein